MSWKPIYLPEAGREASKKVNGRLAELGQAVDELEKDADLAAFKVVPIEQMGTDTIKTRAKLLG